MPPDVSAEGKVWTARKAAGGKDIRISGTGGTFLDLVSTHTQGITPVDETTQRDDERALIERCQAGDRVAFERLYRTYVKDVYSMAMRMSGSPDIAEEVTQEVFISVYKNIGRFQFQSAFTTWLYRIVSRRAADFFRKRKRHERAAPLASAGEEGREWEIEDEGPGPQERAADAEKEKLIGQAIQTLPPKFSGILLLRYNHHMSYEEIAEALGCRIGTVKSRLNRAHKVLQERIQRVLEP